MLTSSIYIWCTDPQADKISSLPRPKLQSYCVQRCRGNFNAEWSVRPPIRRAALFIKLVVLSQAGSTLADPRQAVVHASSQCLDPWPRPEAEIEPKLEKGERPLYGRVSIDSRLLRCGHSSYMRRRPETSRKPEPEKSYLASRTSRNLHSPFPHTRPATDGGRTLTALHRS